jgi:hydroxypyruvate isomerase
LGCRKRQRGIRIGVVEGHHLGTKPPTRIGADSTHATTADDDNTELSPRADQAKTIAESRSRSEVSVVLWPLPGDAPGEKLALAAAAGLRAVAFTSEPLRWTPSQLDDARVTLQAHGLRAATMSALPAVGSGGLVTTARRDRSELLRSLRLSTGTARRLGIRTLVLIAGDRLDCVSRTTQLQWLTDACATCAVIGEEQGVIFALEALNDVLDHPGHALTDAREAAAIVQEVGSPWLRLLFDCYHQQAQHGDALEALAECVACTAVVHVADYPGRGEPGSGVIAWHGIASTLTRACYDGEVSLEYHPGADAAASLARSRALLEAALMA